MHYTMKAYGDTGLRVEFGQDISPEVNHTIRSFGVLLENHPIDGVNEWISTYTALTLTYDPYVISYRDLCCEVEKIAEKMTDAELPPARVIHVPTCYGGEKGPDLSSVAEYNGLNTDEVIESHSGSEYLIYMMGFTPGFPYLGGMPESIATPRLSTPRSEVPAGSVGIAGSQTGVYSISTPGGWQLIGRTPLILYDPYKDPPILLRAGDYVTFDPVSEKEYEKIAAKVKDGTYEPVIEPYSPNE